MNKPVWRMNIGDGVPSDAIEDALIMHNSGHVSKAGGNSSWYWGLKVRYSHGISAYQTNRTKAAKYNRVECYTCKGNTGFLEQEPDGLIHDVICPHCNGKGYTMEAIK